MEQKSKSESRLRLLRLATGIAAVMLLLGKLSETPERSQSEAWANILIWATVLIATALVVWREWVRAANSRAARADQNRFIGVAESGPEALFLFDAQRDAAKQICDFQLSFLNPAAERLLKVSRDAILGQRMSEAFPIGRAESILDKCRQVVESGNPLEEEFPTTFEDGLQLRIHLHVTKLGDGVGIMARDMTAIRSDEERYRTLSNFSNSVFENAPFSIIETDNDGLIRALNRAAEALTGYPRQELLGKALLTNLHDPGELRRRSNDLTPGGGQTIEGFHVLTFNARQGEVDEREWTYIRRDGSTLPVHLAMTAIHNERSEISGFIATASDISERKQMMNYVSHMASHDQLTGMAGRSLLRERIEEAIEKAAVSGRKVAVFVLDLDHFKRLNDSLGHRAGDRILVGMAGRMRESLRRSDTLGRMGGDEFVLVMPHIATLADVERCAKRLVDRVASTAMIEDMEVNLTASVGVCIYPDFAPDADGLLERADAAMYAAKEAGRNRYQIFADAMLRESQIRLTMEAALRHALARDEMFLHYQPLVSLSTGQVIGMEALLRWHHPKLGIVPPATFVPLAEETGLILQIGEWAMKQACAQAKVLCDRMGMQLSLSVNLSPRQVEQSNLVEVVQDALSQSGLSATNLQIELTENTLMINSASNLEKLQQIRDLGARIAIDDFGTGFCSFSYLLQYPVDRLKIDQSFIAKAVTDTNAATVVRTIVAMSHHLGVKVVAEGVETAEHLAFLRMRKCDEAQGYYFSRPVSVAAFPEAVAAIHRKFAEEKRHRLAQPLRPELIAGEAGGLGEFDDDALIGAEFRGKQILM